MEKEEFNPVFGDLEPIDEELDRLEHATKSDLLEKIEDSKVLVTEELTPPVAAWIQDGERKAYFGTLDNFSVIIGKAKAKKSFLLTSVIAAAVSGDSFLGNIKGTLPDDKRRVVLFDTEQSRFHVLNALRSICKQMGIDEPDNIDVYALRKHDYKERREIIEEVIYNTPNLGFVVIDGIRDLVLGINIEEEAVYISGKLLKWTEDLNVHALVVLHMNKGDNNARGHLGTELINKAETVISVTKYEYDSTISLVEPVECRNREFDGFAFRINFEGLPEIAAVTQESKKKTLPSQFTISEHNAKLHYIFTRESELRASDLILAIENEYLIGETNAKKFVSYFFNEGLIRKKPDGKKRLYYLS